MGFVQRLGISKANEALIMSKRISAEEMLQVGFVNKIFETEKSEQEKFLGLVLEEVEERLGDHLNSESLIRVKALIRKPERAVMGSQTMAEVFEGRFFVFFFLRKLSRNLVVAIFKIVLTSTLGLERFAAGVPQEEFRKIASGEKRHKL